MYSDNMTLHQVLRALGYRTKDDGSKHGKLILRGDRVVFDGSADMTWRWLRATHPDFFVS